MHSCLGNGDTESFSFEGDSQLLTDMIIAPTTLQSLPLVQVAFPQY